VNLGTCKSECVKLGTLRVWEKWSWHGSCGGFWWVESLISANWLCSVAIVCGVDGRFRLMKRRLT
jgi:hypothetical protein